MLSGIVNMPGTAGLNAQLAKLGMSCEVVAVSLKSGLAFGRRDTEPNRPETAAKRHKIAINCQTLCTAFGLETVGLTSVGFIGNPGAIAVEDLVEPVVGPGFLPGDNPHTPSLALVDRMAAMANSPALAVPFADAPPAYGVYIVRDTLGQPIGAIQFCIMGVWHRLTGEADTTVQNGKLLVGTGDALIGRTLKMVADVAQRAGGSFRMDDVWMFIGPAASQGFELAGSRWDMAQRKMTADEIDRFVYTETMINNEGKLTVSRFLNLRGWFHGLCLDLDIPPRQIGMINADTVESSMFSSKRHSVDLASGESRQARSGDQIPSNLLFGFLKNCG